VGNCAGRVIDGLAAVTDRLPQDGDGARVVIEQQQQRDRIEVIGDESRALADIPLQTLDALQAGIEQVRFSEVRWAGSRRMTVVQNPCELGDPPPRSVHAA
jgi:hypothetical protein